MLPFEDIMKLQTQPKENGRVHQVLFVILKISGCMKPLDFRLVQAE